MKPKYLHSFCFTTEESAWEFFDVAMAVDRDGPGWPHICTEVGQPNVYRVYLLASSYHETMASWLLFCSV